MTDSSASAGTPVGGGRRSRTEAVTERLVTAIAVGEYLPGTRLPSERDLATLLGVGRVTVRQALEALGARGLLTTRRGRTGGSFVTEQWQPSSLAAVLRTLRARADDLRDGIEAVGGLHGAIARAAAERRTAGDIELMRQRLLEYRDAESGRAAQDADARLHQAIAASAHNRALLRVLHALEVDVSMAAPRHLWGIPDGRRAMELRALGEHEAIVAAIADQRADDAERLARQHVRIDQELLDRALATVEATVEAAIAHPVDATPSTTTRSEEPPA